MFVIFTMFPLIWLSLTYSRDLISSSSVKDDLREMLIIRVSVIGLLVFSVRDSKTLVAFSRGENNLYTNFSNRSV